MYTSGLKLSESYLLLSTLTFSTSSLQKIIPTIVCVCVYVCVCVCVFRLTMECYSIIKKNEIMLFIETWMDLEIVILREIRKRNTNTIWYHLYVDSKIQHKYNINEHIYETITDSQVQRTNVWFPWGRGVGEWRIGSLGLADANYLYREWINSKVLPYSTRNYIQYPVINHNGKESEKEYMLLLLLSRFSRVWLCATP